MYVCVYIRVFRYIHAYVCVYKHVCVCKNQRGRDREKSKLRHIVFFVLFYFQDFFFRVTSTLRAQESIDIVASVGSTKLGTLGQSTVNGLS